MRILSILLFSLFSLSVAHAQQTPKLLGCHQNISANSAAVASMAEIIPGIPNKKVGICGYVIIAGGTPANLQFYYGAPGTNCGTGTTKLTEKINIAPNSTFFNRIPYVYSETPTGQSVCIEITGTGTITYILYFQQF